MNVEEVRGKERLYKCMCERRAWDVWVDVWGEGRMRLGPAAFAR